MLSLLAVTPALADIRVIHASPDTPPVDVYVNDLPGPGVSPAISSLAFTQATPYIGLPGGAYDFRVTPAGAASPVALELLGVNLQPEVDVTVAAIDFFSSIEALTLVDDNTSDPGNARIRFVHASPDAPAVDIRVAGGPVLFSNVAFRGNGGYISVPGGTYDLEVTLAGTSTVVLPLPGVGVDNGAVYSVFAMGGVADLQAVTFVDVVPAPSSLALLGLGGLLAARRRR
jgi:hypothetical protein